MQDEPLRDEHGAIIAWLAKARAIHLTTGAFQDADGSCSFSEKVARNPKQQAQMRTIHNIRAHAVTRAKNRAILDLVGFGEVSAEETKVLVITQNHKDHNHESWQAKNKLATSRHYWKNNTGLRNHNGDSYCKYTQESRVGQI